MVGYLKLPIVDGYQLEVDMPIAAGNRTMPAWYRNEFDELVIAHREGVRHDRVVYRHYDTRVKDLSWAYLTEDYLLSRGINVIDWLQTERSIDKIQIIEN